MVKRILIVSALLLLLLPMYARADMDSAADYVTESQGFPRLSALFDGDTKHGPKGQDHASITFRLPEDCRYAYLIFDTEYGPSTVANAETGEVQTAGTDNFLHTLVDLQALFPDRPETVTFHFDNGPVPLLELTLLEDGPLPSWVQQWLPPVENGADLVLFSTHADDDQLFFAGVLPYYAGQLGYRVQVVYLTNHRNLSEDPNIRCHEALDGLWAVGVRHYPVFGSFGDYYSRREQDAINQYAQAGVSQDTLLEFVVTQLRRFRPLVALGHDLNGEYGHGAHCLYADLLTQALDAAADGSRFEASAAQYGPWQTPKLYLHLYEENQITLDWDQPLSAFGGLTAFQVTKQLGFPAHASQQSGFAWYMSGIDRAADIPKYSPCNYGLWRSTVGPDAEKTDFFESLTPYAQQEALARQEAQEQLAEQLRQEEQARLEQAGKETQTEAAGLPMSPDAPAQPETPWILVLAPVLLVAVTLALYLRKRP